jgi:hypothetical protein
VIHYIGSAKTVHPIWKKFVYYGLSHKLGDQFFRITTVDLITSLKGSLHNLQKSFMHHGRSNIRIASTVGLLWMARVFKQTGIGKKLRDGVKMG